MTLLFALLALVAAAGAVGVVVLRLSSRSAFARAWLDSVGENAGSLAALVAVVATLGSLYLSEIAHFDPCTLCWYQRIAMYPMAPLLVLGRRDPRMRLYIPVLAGVGALLSTYHVIIERVPSWDGGVCEVDNPCSARIVERLGFITIPAMALAGFVAIFVLMTVTPRASELRESRP
jgi:disulfide bond formation protein DsbB